MTVHEIVIDNDGETCAIVGYTASSVEVLIPAKTKRGITCTQWFDAVDAMRRFCWCPSDMPAVDFAISEALKGINATINQRCDAALKEIA